MIALVALVSLGAAPARAEEPLTLERALDLAGKKNPDLALSRLQADSAAVDAYASWAAVLPRLDLTASFGRSYFGAQQKVIAAPTLFTDEAGELQLRFDQKVVDIPGEGFSNYSLGLQLQQPLFDGFRGPSLIRRGRLGVVAAGRQVDEATLGLAFEVTRRFFELVKAERGQGVLAEAAQRSEELVRRSEALFEAGRVQKADAIAARVNLSQDRINLELQKARAAQARAELGAVLGSRLEDGIEVLAPAELDSAEGFDEVAPVEALLERARAARPGFARLRALLDAAELDERIARSTRYPAVGASLAYDRSGPNLAGSDGVYGDPTRQFVASAQLFVQWNLFNGRQTSADEQRAAIAHRRLEAEVQQLERQIEAEVARARASLVALGAAVGLARQSLQSAEQGVQLARERLEAGAATQLELRDASLKLTQAKLTLVNTRIDYLVARAELQRAIGTPPPPTSAPQGKP